TIAAAHADAAVGRAAFGGAPCAADVARATDVDIGVTRIPRTTSARGGARVGRIIVAILRPAAGRGNGGSREHADPSNEGAPHNRAREAYSQTEYMRDASSRESLCESNPIQRGIRNPGALAPFHCAQKTSGSLSRRATCERAM